MTDNAIISNSIKNYLYILKELRDIGVITNSKDFTSQIGEWLVEQIYEGKRAPSGIQRYWDVKVNETKIQIKTHAKSSTTNARWSYIKQDIIAEIDILIIIVFTSDYKLKEFYEVPWKEALPIIKKEKDGDKIYWNDIRAYQKELISLPRPYIISIFQ